MADALEGVVFAQIEPTTRCNFTCGFCCGRHMPQQDVSVEIVEIALRRMPQLEVIELQGEGEPLLHPDFFTMVKLAKEHKVTVFTITNGSLLNKKNISKILKSGISKLSVSMESADPKTFRELRGGSLDRVHRGLQNLMHARSIDHSGPFIGLSVTVLKETLQDVPRIIDLYRSLALDGGISFQLLEGMDFYSQYYDERLTANLWSITEASSVYKELASIDGYDEVKQDSKQNPGFYSRLFAGWEPASRTCPWVEKGIFVGREGNLSACCLMKNTSKYSWGNIQVTSSAEILHHRENLRIQIKSGTPPKACQGCRVIATIDATLGISPKPHRRIIPLHKTEPQLDN